MICATAVAVLDDPRRYSDLQSFLDLYYAGCDVLRSEADFQASLDHLAWSEAA